MRVIEYENGTPIYELTLEECRTYGYCYPCYGACIGYEPESPNDLEETAGISNIFKRRNLIWKITTG